MLCRIFIDSVDNTSLLRKGLQNMLYYIMMEKNRS